MSEEKTKGRIKRAIVNIAPGLATALGGPLAGAAVAQLSRLIFGNENVDEETLSAVLEKATPETILAIKKAEQEFKIEIAKTNAELLRVDASDRADARARQIKMNDWTPSILGALVIVGFFVVLGFMIARKLPPGTETEFSIMLGALATMTAAVVNYFFGSSAGSREKTQLIAYPAMPPKDDGAVR
ncbi:hypothetical protein ABFZ85_05695 [Hyphococcus formosus]|uniref:hypothetical protein n=1 Tax=Hyphococcus formosus TaxID=3143534 RepID=UPI00398B353A